MSMILGMLPVIALLASSSRNEAKKRRATVLTPDVVDVAIPDDSLVVFLAGSIDEGRAERWQDEAISSLGDLDIVLLNPRRENWNADLEQSVEEPRFVQQVEWELDGIERADVVLFHFSPNGPAPISLLELGKATALGKRVVVSCPDGYWRRGNVEIVTRRAGGIFEPSLPDAMDTIRRIVEEQKNGTS